MFHLVLKVGALHGDSGEDGGDEQRGARAVAATRGTPPPPASWGSAAP
jgi:hypothetical protein